MCGGEKYRDSETVSVDDDRGVSVCACDSCEKDRTNLAWDPLADLCDLNDECVCCGQRNGLVGVRAR